MTIDTTKEWYSFWRWLFVGYQNKPGFKIIFNRKILLDIFIGFAVSSFYLDNISVIAPSVILPLLAAFIGLAIGVVSGVGALATSNEMINAVKKGKIGMVEYVYPFNLAILVIFLTIFFWVIGASKICDDVNIFVFKKNIYPFEMLGFFLLSMSLRISWETLNSYASLVLFIYEIKKNSEN